MGDLDTVNGRNDAYCAGYADGKAGRPFCIPAHLTAYAWDYHHGWDKGCEVHAQAEVPGDETEYDPDELAYGKD